MRCSIVGKNEGVSVGFGKHYRQLFVQIEETLLKVMRTDRSDNYSRTERGWIPPKGYTDDFK